MATNKRWGKPFVDNRDWSKYNEHLVQRGEFYLSLDFIAGWDTELSRMNSHKRGRRYVYPVLFIQWVAAIYVLFSMPYRQMEGFLRKLSLFVHQDLAADYTTLFRRIRMFELPLSDTIKQTERDVIVAIDSTGIKVTNRGEWMREKWRIHQGWIKVHVVIDRKSREILAMEVTDETISDKACCIPLIYSAQDSIQPGTIRTILGDGAYDHLSIFNELEDRHISSSIKIRSNASWRSHGSAYRAECAREFLDSGYREWAQRHNYGSRWSVEGVFSSMKRIFGESVKATSIDGMFHELQLKFSLYNLLINC
ncbi:MAG: IS5 family transposase [Methanoregula sp.]|nr:IS5 family transposase [Methanoregula sp.]